MARVGDIGQHHVPADDRAAVLAVNRAFYEAFETRDLDAMSDLWEHSDRSLCTHPGWATLRGWASVSASFFALFQSGAPLQFILTNERVEVEGGTAWVSLDENILSDEIGGGTVAALNVFARHGPAWRLIVHHASLVVASAPDPDGDEP